VQLGQFCGAAVSPDGILRHSFLPGEEAFLWRQHDRPFPCCAE
jgi:hypothetical protein